MTPMVRTFLSLSYYDGWLRHGSKLELTPSSGWSFIYCSKGSRQGAASQAAAFCCPWQRVFRKDCSSRPAEAKLLCSSSLPETPINLNHQPVHATRTGPQASETGSLSPPLCISAFNKCVPEAIHQGRNRYFLHGFCFNFIFSAGLIYFKRQI